MAVLAAQHAKLTRNWNCPPGSRSTTRWARTSHPTSGSSSPSETCLGAAPWIAARLTGSGARPRQVNSQVGKTKARAGNPVPTDDEETVATAMMALLEATEKLFGYQYQSLLTLLTTVNIFDAPAEFALELVESLVATAESVPGLPGGYEELYLSVEQRSQSTALGMAVALFDDAGLWVRDGDRFTGTDLGREFTHVFVSLIAMGYLDD